jgi:hypothetical protein
VNAEQPGREAGLPSDDDSNTTPDLSWNIGEIDQAMRLAPSYLYRWATAALSTESLSRQETMIRNLLEIALHYVPRTADDMPAAMPIDAVRVRGDAFVECRFCGYQFSGNPLGEACRIKDCRGSQ